MTIKRILKIAAAVLAAIYIAAACYLNFEQDRILFPSPKNPAGKKYDFGFPFKEVWIETDGAKLHGLYFPASSPRGLIIFFHGNTEKAEQFGKHAREFTSQGYDYFVPDFRGYGKSTGNITSEKQFLGDMDRVYDWARQKYPENKIVLAGRSMGSVPAVYLGAKNKPRCVVMIAPLFNVAAMKDIRYPYLPDFLVRYQFRSDLWIQQLRCPVYLIHGTRDKTIPFHHAERLFDLAHAPKRYFTVPGAGHSDLQDFPVYHKILYYLMSVENN